jgi:hypothetical protein
LPLSACLNYSDYHPVARPVHVPVGLSGFEDRRRWYQCQPSPPMPIPSEPRYLSDDPRVALPPLLMRGVCCTGAKIPSCLYSCGQRQISLLAYFVSAQRLRSNEKQEDGNERVGEKDRREVLYGVMRQEGPSRTEFKTQVLTGRTIDRPTCRQGGRMT